MKNVAFLTMLLGAAVPLGHAGAASPRSDPGQVVGAFLIDQGRNLKGVMRCSYRVPGQGIVNVTPSGRQCPVVMMFDVSGVNAKPTGSSATLGPVRKA